MADKDPKYDVIWLVRRVFQALGQASNQLLSDQGITASHRAVLEFLYPDQRMTMSDVARKHNVTRQHIQAVAQDLLAKGLLKSQPNPASKRAPHLYVSPAGRKLFQKIRQKEARVMDTLFADLKIKDIKVTQKVLQILLDNAQSFTRQMKGND